MVYEHSSADETSVSVEEKGEVFPTTTRDETEDSCNSGVTTRMVEVRGAYGATTLKCRNVGSNPTAVKIVRGVSEHAKAVRALNSVLITEDPKKKNTRAHVVDTDG